MADFVGNGGGDDDPSHKEEYDEQGGDEDMGIDVDADGPDDEQDANAEFIGVEDIAEEYEVVSTTIAASGNEADDDMSDGESEATLVIDMSEVTFARHSEPVYCIAVNPKLPTQFVTGGGDDKAFLWNIAPGGMILSHVELTGHTDTVNAVGFSADGALVATGCYGGVLKVWDAESGSEKTVLEGPDDVEWLSWHKGGNVLLAGSQDGTVWMWQAVSGACMQVFAGHVGRVTCGTFNSSGKAIVTGSEDGTVRVWAPRTGECRHTFGDPGFHVGPVTCIASHPVPDQAALLLSGGEDGTARLVHTQNKRVLGTLTHCSPEEGSVECVGFCLTHQWAATGGTDNCMKVWDTVSGTCRHTCTHPSGVTKLAWHSTAPLIVTSCADGAIRVWDARTGVCQHTLTGHTDMVHDFDLVDMRFSPGVEGLSVDGVSSVGAGGGSAGSLPVELVTSSDDCTAKVFRLDLGTVGSAMHTGLLGRAYVAGQQSRQL